MDEYINKAANLKNEDLKQYETQYATLIQLSVKIKELEAKILKLEKGR